MRRHGSDTGLILLATVCGLDVSDQPNDDMYLPLRLCRREQPG